MMTYLPVMGVLILQSFNREPTQTIFGGQCQFLSEIDYFPGRCFGKLPFMRERNLKFLIRIRNANEYCPDGMRYSSRNVGPQEFDPIPACFMSRLITVSFLGVSSKSYFVVAKSDGVKCAQLNESDSVSPVGVTVNLRPAFVSRTSSFVPLCAMFSCGRI